MPKPASDWVTLAEAAEILGAANVSVSTSTLARWVRAGRLQAIRPGRRIYVRRAQVRGLLRPRPIAVRVADVQPGLFETLDGGERAVRRGGG
jgi:excisionase family DNA binding protein